MPLKLIRTSESESIKLWGVPPHGGVARVIWCIAVQLRTKAEERERISGMSIGGRSVPPSAVLTDLSMVSFKVASMMKFRRSLAPRNIGGGPLSRSDTTA